MNKLIFLPLFLLLPVCAIAQPVVPSTSWSRSFLRSTNQDQGRNALGIVGTNMVVNSDQFDTTGPLAVKSGAGLTNAALIGNTEATKLIIRKHDYDYPLLLTNTYFLGSRIYFSDFIENPLALNIGYAEIGTFHNFGQIAGLPDNDNGYLNTAGLFFSTGAYDAAPAVRMVIDGQGKMWVSNNAAFSGTVSVSNSLSVNGSFYGSGSGLSNFPAAARFTNHVVVNQTNEGFLKVAGDINTPGSVTGAVSFITSDAGGGVSSLSAGGILAYPDTWTLSGWTGVAPFNRVQFISNNATFGGNVIADSFRGGGELVTNVSRLPTPISKSALVVQGDSMSVVDTWFAVFTNMPPYNQLSLATNFATAGWTAYDVWNNYSNGPQYAILWCRTNGVTPYCPLWAGQNDMYWSNAMTGASSALEYNTATAANILRDGGIPILFTVTPRGDGKGRKSELIAFNQAIRDGTNIVVDPAYRMPNPFNTTYYNADTVHNVATGYNVVADLLDFALRSGPRKGSIHPSTADESAALIFGAPGMTTNITIGTSTFYFSNGGLTNYTVTP